MNILRHHYQKDLTPDKVKCYCNLDTLLVITMDDIKSNIRNVNSLRGMSFSTILIPKELGYHENNNMVILKELEESILWHTIKPTLYNREVKVIFY